MHLALSLIQRSRPNLGKLPRKIMQVARTAHNTLHTCDLRLLQSLFFRQGNGLGEAPLALQSLSLSLSLAFFLQPEFPSPLALSRTPDRVFGGIVLQQLPHESHEVRLEHLINMSQTGPCSLLLPTLSFELLRQLSAYAPQ